VRLLLYSEPFPASAREAARDDNAQQVAVTLSQAQAMGSYGTCMTEKNSYRTPVENKP